MLVQNKEVERTAVNFAKKYYQKRGYSIEERPGRGYDLSVSKGRRRYLIEVKGRTKKWGFINTPMKEVEVLKKPNARLFEVIINDQTKKVEFAYEFRCRDFGRKRHLGYALYPRRTSRNLVYPKS